MELYRRVCTKGFEVTKGNGKGIKLVKGRAYFVAEKDGVAFVFSDFRIEVPTSVFGPELDYEPAREGI